MKLAIRAGETADDPGRLLSVDLWVTAGLVYAALMSFE
jgi:hypothetical protein